MDDQEILDLYWQRSERAVEETELKYGGYCGTIALNILSVREDAEECVSDTWMHAWQAIPPERPSFFKAWLGKVTKNLALSRWRMAHRQKRFAGFEAVFEELEECLPGGEPAEDLAEAAELSEILSEWLRNLKEEDRYLFIRRYWYGDAVKDLSKHTGYSVNRISLRLSRLREKLRNHLEKEGIAV